MKIVGVILKILAALAAIAGIVYVVATYGDKIVLWAKKLLGICECDCECACECEGEGLEIGFNYRYVLDALRNAGLPQVKLLLNEPTMPMTVVPTEGDDFLYLILPVRLRSNE